MISDSKFVRRLGFHPAPGPGRPGAAAAKLGHAGERATAAALGLRESRGEHAWTSVAGFEKPRMQGHRGCRGTVPPASRRLKRRPTAAARAAALPLLPASGPQSRRRPQRREHRDTAAAGPPRRRRVPAPARDRRRRGGASAGPWRLPAAQAPAHRGGDGRGQPRLRSCRRRDRRVGADRSGASAGPLRLPGHRARG